MKYAMGREKNRHACVAMPLCHVCLGLCHHKPLLYLLVWRREAGRRRRLGRQVEEKAPLSSLLVVIIGNWKRKNVSLLPPSIPSYYLLYAPNFV